MSKAEIIAELAQLTPEDLADIRAWLDCIAGEKSAAGAVIASTRAARIRSPRLADPAKAADFKKDVTELTAHAPI